MRGAQSYLLKSIYILYQLQSKLDVVATTYNHGKSMSFIII
jgi:hypothetical protein